MSIIDSLKTVCIDLLKLRNAVEIYKDNNEISYYKNISMRRNGRIDLFTEIKGRLGKMNNLADPELGENLEEIRNKNYLLDSIQILLDDVNEFKSIPDISKENLALCDLLKLDLNGLKKELTGDNKIENKLN